MTTVRPTLAAVQQQVAAAVARAGRTGDSVTLIAASKTIPAEVIEEAVAAGQTVFGENRVQEAMAKWPALLDRHRQIRLHLIGPLQTNKARDAVRFFDTIHSVDRVALAAALAKESQKQGRRPECFIQVNIGAEPQKAGASIAEVDSLIAACRSEYELDVAGLTCIPPSGEPPERHFTMLAEIAARNGLKCLSMGMSQDFPAAIECGATHVRVGTAIFGKRAA
ncbi:YggS family pyridoxal phosphate-dependent enzyme [Micromonospora sp. DT53]|uniref:YggS family pyridoxal phosphate-dependent enzyme n=1 Tax=Micromonospora sp. DT53 TaxID=3393444 RepID=UPI003CE77BDC